jgi:hypothetical protein
MRGLRWWLTLAILSALSVTIQAQSADVPHLERRGKVTQLVVSGKPFLILGGELHNSSSSSLSNIDRLWPRLEALRLNTVLEPVSWELLEPKEGQFDFALVDGLIHGARQHQLRLILLWFGSWKSTYSSYVPSWVKLDTERFPRVHRLDGGTTARLSPFSRANREADARAFAALMRHIRETDGDAHTVLMVQVENEVGVIPDARDYSPAADASFKAPIPDELAQYLRQHMDSLDPTSRAQWKSAGGKLQGTWTDAFGRTPFSDDMFMAWYYARYISAVVAAGKREYPLPMFANAALIRPNYVPGQYNSGGPLPHSRDLWRAAAPNLDFLSPDIYFRDFASWAARYAVDANPLFIPEAIGGPVGAGNAQYAFGQLNAIGFSPFAIEDEAPLSSENPQSMPSALANAYLTLAHLAPLILEKQQDGDTAAIVLDSDEQRAGRVTLGDYAMTVARPPGSGNGPQSGSLAVLFLRMGPDEYVIAGSGKAVISFSSVAPGPAQAGILSIDEETLVEGKWSLGRRLNGDESAQGQLLRIPSAAEAPPSIFHVRLYRYR